MVNEGFWTLLHTLITEDQPNLNGAPQYNGTQALEWIFPALKELWTKTSMALEKKMFQGLYEYYEANHVAPGLNMWLQTIAKSLKESEGSDLNEYWQKISGPMPLLVRHIWTDISDILRQYQESRDMALLEKTYIQTLHMYRGDDVFENRDDAKVLAGRKGFKNAIEHLSSVVDTLRPIPKGIHRRVHDEPLELAWDIHMRNIELREQARLIYTGMPQIDGPFEGFTPGSFIGVLGWAKDGKSTVVLNWAYQNLLLGRNGVYITLEMRESLVMDRLYALHSHHPKFRAIHGGLSPRSLQRRGTEEQELFLHDHVIPDLQSLPGKLHIEYANSGVSVAQLRKMLELYDKMDNGEYPLDYFILDYPDKMDKVTDANKKLSPWQITESLYSDLKNICDDFGDGRQIVGIFPTQVNRSGRDKAEKNGGVYDLGCIGSTHGIATSCTQMFYVYSDQHQKSQGYASIGLIVDREGAMVDPFVVEVDKVTGYIDATASANWDPYEEPKAAPTEWKKGRKHNPNDPVPEIPKLTNPPSLVSPEIRFDLGSE